MTESDDDSADISKALLEAADSSTNPFSFDDSPVTKRRKTSGKRNDPNAPTDDLDLFTNEVHIKSKLNGSSFKNMGLGLDDTL